MNGIGRVRILAAFGTVSIGLSLLASAQAADFFEGKQIKVIVGSSAGSGYDINARLFARHFVNHIPGKPGIVVQNQPGAGSVILGNSIYNTAPKDGTTIGAAINGMPTAYLFKPKAVKYDPRKFIWLGSTNRDTQISYAWHTSGIKTVDDVFKKNYLVGATNPGTTQVDFPAAAAKLFGMKFKIVSGYKGTTDIHIAMERGEVQGMGSNAWLSLNALKPDWVKDKRVNILVQFNINPNPQLPGVPTIFKFAKDDKDRQALTLLVSRLEYGRPFFLPPGVPAERVKTLRSAFDATMNDKAYLAEADKAKIDVNPMSGEDVSALIAKVMDTPTDVVARVVDALATGGR
ncbi:MAG: Bug family tripartite tricarboxylate transporter substrate binding protein [Beijerinckiaceae bacterium]